MFGLSSQAEGPGRDQAVGSKGDLWAQMIPTFLQIGDPSSWAALAHGQWGGQGG